MKRSAPTPVQAAVQTEVPNLSFAVIRTALISLSFVALLLVGLFFFFRARNHRQASIVVPSITHAQTLHLASIF